MKLRKVLFMKKALYNFFLQYKTSEDGSVVLIVVFILLAMLTSAGVAIDMSRIQAAKSKLSTCLDTAGLAAISKIGDVPNDKTVKQWVTENVNKYFLVNCRFGYQDTAVSITNMSLSADNNILTMDATTQQTTKVLSVVGINSVIITAHSVVKRASDAGLELVMVLDNTGSMAQQVDSSQPSSAKKIDALKSAATSMVNKLFLGSNTSTSNSWIGIVPFAQAVNIGGTNSPNNSWNNNWVKFNNEDFGPTFGANSTCDGSPKTTKATSTTPATCSYSNHSETNFKALHWYGCVEARDSPDDISDENPAISPFPVYYFAPQDIISIISKYPNDPPTGNHPTYPQLYRNPLWVSALSNPWKRVFIPDPDNFNNVLTVYDTPLLNVVNPATVPPAYPYPIGPNAYCTSPITPMTHDKATLINGINLMTPNGQTIIPAGLAWGWRMLSPKWRGFWGGDMATSNLPSDYNQNGKIKAIIFMTDGNNSFFPGSYTAYGQLYDKRLGTNNETKAEKELDRRTRQVCDDIKDTGITIYTIGFGQTDNVHNFAAPGQEPDVNGHLLRYCATNSTSYFFAPSNDELDKAFDAIAAALLNPRVSQ